MFQYFSPNKHDRLNKHRRLIANLALIIQQVPGTGRNQRMYITGRERGGCWSWVFFWKSTRISQSPGILAVCNGQSPSNFRKYFCRTSIGNRERTVCTPFDSDVTKSLRRFRSRIPNTQIGGETISSRWSGLAGTIVSRRLVAENSCRRRLQNGSSVVTQRQSRLGNADNLKPYNSNRTKQWLRLWW